MIKSEKPSYRVGKARHKWFYGKHRMEYQNTNKNLALIYDGFQKKKKFTL